jgi:UDP-2,3-diacylglucosamine pyrophosphatase LpxH
MDALSPIIIISDIHLGSKICQDEKLLKFLRQLEWKCKKLIINGDLFDHWDFKKLSDNHWTILKTIRKLSSKIEVIWIRGNHDGPSDMISHLIGVEFLDEYYFTQNSKSFIVVHGDIFDDFLSRYPLLTKIADSFYRLVQKLDPSFYWPRLLKRSSKTFLRAIEKVKYRAKNYCENHHYDGIICGHTHMSDLDENDSIHYYNSGCWTSAPCSYLIINEAVIKIEYL